MPPKKIKCYTKPRKDGSKYTTCNKDIKENELKVKLKTKPAPAKKAPAKKKFKVVNPAPAKKAPAKKKFKVKPQPTRAKGLQPPPPPSKATVKTTKVYNTTPHSGQTASGGQRRLKKSQQGQVDNFLSGIAHESPLLLARQKETQYVAPAVPVSAPTASMTTSAPPADSLATAIGVTKEQANNMNFFDLMNMLPGDAKRNIGGKVKADMTAEYGSFGVEHGYRDIARPYGAADRRGEDSELNADREVIKRLPAESDNAGYYLYKDTNTYPPTYYGQGGVPSDKYGNKPEHYEKHPELYPRLHKGLFDNSSKFDKITEAYHADLPTRDNPNPAHGIKLVKALEDPENPVPKMVYDARRKAEGHTIEGRKLRKAAHKGKTTRQINKDIKNINAPDLGQTREYGEEYDFESSKEPRFTVATKLQGGQKPAVLKKNSYQSKFHNVGGMDREGKPKDWAMEDLDRGYYLNRSRNATQADHDLYKGNIGLR